MVRVLIIGGSGRIGSSIAEDLLKYTAAEITITGRNLATGASVSNRLGERVKFLALDLDQPQEISPAVAEADLVIDTAGPFYHRSLAVLQACIDRRVNYLDVSDERGFTQRALALHDAAQAASITAIVNTGVFPGISNSMAREGVESLDTCDTIHLSYIVAGSGGAGVTVMRTTFIGLQRPFKAWLKGKWQEVKPYTAPEVLDFPPPYGRSRVYWYDMPEAFTLATSFPVQSVFTKFGITPGFYNHLTWMAAHLFPAALLQRRSTVEFLAQVSHGMTDFTDRYSGTGVAVRSAVTGQHNGKPATYLSTFVHESAARATGYGTGSLAQLLVEGKINQPGVWPVEAVLPTPLFQSVMQQRHLEATGRMIALA